MTRARALKKAIRARAAKTGERYTAARRHVLKEVLQRPRPDAKTVERTGRGLDHWFEVLDRFDALEKGHTATARHLREAHHVDSWYAQSITGAYERARGARARNQRSDGKYEVSVSKVVTARTADVIAVLTDKRLRRRWMAGVDARLASGFFSALDRPAAKGFVVRMDGLAQFRYKWDDTTVQFYLSPKPGGKVSIVVAHTMPSAAALEERRQQWRVALRAVAGLLAE